MKIIHKLILQILIVILLIGIVGYFAIDKSKQALRENIGKNSVILATQLLDKIDWDLHNKSEIFQEYMTSVLVQKFAAQSNSEYAKITDVEKYIDNKDKEWRIARKKNITPFMTSLMNNELANELKAKIAYYEKQYGFRVFGEVFITNKYGANIAQTNKTSDFRQNDEGWWQKAAKNGIYAKNVEYDDSANVYSIDVAIRIEDKDKNLIGVAKVVINVEEIIKLITNWRQELLIDKNEFTSTQLQLLTQEGKIVCSTNKYKFLEQMPQQSFSQFAVNKEKQYFLADTDSSSKMYAYAHAKNNRFFKDFGWVLIVEHEAKKVFAPVVQLRNAIFIPSLAITLLGVLMGIFIANSISRSLSKLQEATVEISSGNLNAEFNIGSKDEIGQLAAAFKEMAENLGKTTISRNELEEQVEKRTAELKKINEQLEKANKHKSMFLANMSHELRTPLNAIIGYSELLIEDANDLEQNEFLPDLNKIRAAGKHLLSLINEILDLSKIEAGKMELHLETFKINELVQEIAITARPLANKNKNNLQIECAEDVGNMYSDPTKVRQCLLNLLSNACKFTTEGTVTLKVFREIDNERVLSPDDIVTFLVKDEGIGLSQEQITNLFQPFVQADASTTRQYGGTGLGLTITKQFCHMMGGDISVTSEKDQGSIFKIALPTRTMEIRDDEQIAFDGPLPEGAKTVLVIDDDPSVCDIIRRFMAKEQVHIEVANNGEMGLKKAREILPAVITLDVMMPEMDGWSVLSKLKSDPILAQIPVIMISMIDDKNTGFALGAAEYMIKPIDKNNLINLVKKFQHNNLHSPILIVEDDANTRDVTVRILQKEGYRVVEAENGRIGLESVAEEIPKLILLDLMMPEVDGFQFLVQLRKNPDWQNIPVIVLTAKTITSEDSLKLTGYVKQILQKGVYNREELLIQIKGLIGAWIKP